MKDKELKRNASGYIDEPCYRAVTAPPRTGEIWLHRQSGAYMLVLANSGGVCPTLRLTENAEAGTVPVMCRVQMYTKPHMIGYCFDNLLTQFVKAVKGEEMTAVRKGIIKALGLFDEITKDSTVPALPHDYINALEEQVRTLTDERDKARAAAKECQFDLEAKIMAEKMTVDGIAQMEEEITRLNIYKDMYMNLIDRLVSVRGGRCCQ